MVLPDTLQKNLEAFLSQFDLETLKLASERLSLHYREGRSLQEKEEYAAYVAVRLPATFEALTAVFHKIPFSIETLLDLGAGPGTASFAAKALWGENIEITSVERSILFFQIAQKLFAPSQYILKDLREIDFLPPHDIVCFGYSFGEMELDVLEKGWQATKKALVIVEPGTPRGYQNILKARDMLLSWGGFLLAPCPHAKQCPLARISHQTSRQTASLLPQIGSQRGKDRIHATRIHSVGGQDAIAGCASCQRSDKKCELDEGDWCHFSQRVPRQFLHRQIKKAILPFEDEKYSYLIVSKEPFAILGDRILRDPILRKGHVYLHLCCQDGKARTVILSKKQKEIYKKARKARIGDLFGSHDI